MKQYKYTINGKSYHVIVKKLEDTVAEVEVNGTTYRVLMDKPEEKRETQSKRPAQAPPVGASPAVNPVKTISHRAIQSPLPGVIISIDCQVGDAVKKGQKLLVLEAMKMENTIPSEWDGIVSEIKVKLGDSVAGGAELVIIK